MNLLMLVLLMVTAQSVSDQLEQRTGQILPGALKEGPANFSLPPGVTFTDQLSVRAAVSIALWNNTALQAQLASLEVSRSDLVEAGMFRNPSFSMLLPVGPKPFEFLLTWPIEELWQRKQRVKSAQLNVNAVAMGLVQSGVNLIREVRAAHADLWLAEQRAQIYGESAKLRDRIVILTEKRRANGDATGIDVNLAQADSRSTAEIAQRTLNDVEIARSRLRHLLGLRGDAKPFSAVMDSDSSIPLPAPASLVETAMSNRPDLRAAEVDVETTAERAKWQRSRLLNMLAPALSVKDIGAPGVRSGPGLNMEVPVLSRNQGQISKADAEVVRSARLYVSMKDQVELEVLEAQEKVFQARTALAQLREQIRPAVDETIRLTDRAYQNGDVSLLNVLEVTRQRFDIVLREVEAQAALQRAYADLERAIGRSL